MPLGLNVGLKGFEMKRLEPYKRLWLGKQAHRRSDCPCASRGWIGSARYINVENTITPPE
jgi:hypothetical protein